MKILFSGFRDMRHSASAGYDKIAEFPEADYISDKDVFCRNISVGKKGKCINLFFLDIITRCLRYRYDITHIFYGDSSILFPYIKSKKHKLVATIHLNINERKRLPKLFIKALKQLDGLIVLSSNQAAQIYNDYGIDAKFIPHGFSKPQYNFTLPSDFNKTYLSDNLINIFYSGTQYRDFKLFVQVVEYCKLYPNITFHVVGQVSATRESLSHCNNVHCYNRLNDNEYYTLLSICDWNFLPLTFATANNALLEAQFIGIRSVLPRMSGIEDYAAPSPYNKFYSNKEELFSFFNKIPKNSKSVELIEHSMKFEWGNIYKQLDEYYKQVLNKDH